MQGAERVLAARQSERRQPCSAPSGRSSEREPHASKPDALGALSLPGLPLAFADLREPEATQSLHPPGLRFWDGLSGRRFHRLAPHTGVLAQQANA